MKGEDELGEWRRSHYSSQVTPELDGKTAVVFGWVSSVRAQGRLIFVILTDRDGIVQVTLNRERLGKKLLQQAESLLEHSSVGVKGTVRKIEKAPNGAEIIPEEIRILATPRERPSFGIVGGNIPSIDKRLDMRAVDLRRERPQSLFRIERTALRGVREFLARRGYQEVITPKLISTATEGGASLFSVLYYNRPAFLTQSPQLYKEELVLPFEKVFEVGPAFRAEESRTQKHLSEITSIDLEEAFVDYRDVMDTLEALIKHVADDVRDSCRRDLEKLKLEPVEVPGRFERLRYDEAVTALKKHRKDLSWGDDITGADVENLGREHRTFYFVTDWPTLSKPFYIKPSAANPKVCEAFDLMHGPLELASGGSRVSTKSLLVKRLKEQKLKPEAFEHHLKVYDYGMPPHAGFGMGLERLMMALTGEENIRELALYPRDKTRLAP